LLKITGYSQSKLLGNGVAVQSCEFEAGGYRWCILYYLRSTKSADSIYIELKLTSKEVSRPVNTKIQLRFELKLRKEGRTEAKSNPVYADPAPRRADAAASAGHDVFYVLAEYPCFATAHQLILKWI
jgi:hypothetical protein